MKTVGVLKKINKKQGIIQGLLPKMKGLLILNLKR